MVDDVLGPLKAWQIKDFPEHLRNRVVAAAADAGQSVGEFVTAAMLRELDGVNGFANRLNRPADVVGDLVKLSAASGPWTEHNPMPGELRALINGYARVARGAIAAIASTHTVIPGSQSGTTEPEPPRIGGRR